jgi:hypothetical protein
MFFYLTPPSLTTCFVLRGEALYGAAWQFGLAGAVVGGAGAVVGGAVVVVGGALCGRGRRTLRSHVPRRDVSETSLTTFLSVLTARGLLDSPLAARRSVLSPRRAGPSPKVCVSASEGPFPEATRGNLRKGTNLTV